MAVKNKTKSPKSSGRKPTKTTTRNTSPPPAPAAEAPAAATKIVTELTAEEARKECVKLKLIGDGEKTKRETCIVKLSEFLGVHGLPASTFKFSANGNTRYPNPVLEKGPSDSSNDEKESDENEDCLLYTSPSPRD